MDVERYKKILKTKIKLYIKFVKSKNPEDELIYQNYKTPFRKMKEKNQAKL